MALYAVMHGDTVENVIVCDDKETAETVTGKTCIQYSKENPAGIGWTYDKDTNVFINPNPPVEEV